MTRLEQQFAFITEAFRLSEILRRTTLPPTGRRQNDAEHCWHLTLMAVVLREYANAPVDLARVLKLLIVHDLVEIDAGDTPAYDTAALATQAERERVAAERIFGLLPAEQAAELRGCWEEFEERATPEARFALAMDRLQPMLLNWLTDGASWREHHVTRAMAEARNRVVADGAAPLWEHALTLLDEAVRRGWLPER